MRSVKKVTVLGSIVIALALFIVIVIGPLHALADTNSNPHLQAAQLRVCQNREAAIDRKFSNLIGRSQRQLALFTTIAIRVERFYAQKGKKISNYNALVTDVTVKKTAAIKQFTALQTSNTFSCTANNPKGVGEAFKTQLHNTIDALKAYKTAVKNLIVGVKSAEGVTSSNKNENSNSSNANAS